MPPSEPINWETVLGSFDPYNLEITSIFSKNYTDEPVNPDSDESLTAWTTMIHEWVHFMQFCSTTYGLLLTLNRIFQQFALIRLCQTIGELMKAHGETPVLYIPLRKAWSDAVYPQYLQQIINDFIVEWYSTELKVMTNHGVLAYSKGKSTYQTLSPKILRKLKRTKAHANVPLTVGHIVEPIAVGCVGQWLIQEFGIEQTAILMDKINPTGLVYTLLPQVETELDINVHTRMVLHDLALMLPVEDRSSGKPATPQRYSPTTRMIASLELIASGEVAQVPDSEPPSYLRLASDLSRRLDWPDYESLVTAALRKAKDFRTTFSEAMPYRQVIDDFVRGFEVRRRQPDAFVAITPASFALYSSGWQPIWRQEEGWMHHDSQSVEQGNARLWASLSIQASRAFVVGGTWECPLIRECEASSSRTRGFPSAGPGLKSCHCRVAVQEATGWVFEPDQVISMETNR
ncbi:MAG TPA: hypothetical protein VFR47_29670 [Anaerolineales bacterium]|nr:hypothetical protein [Anaerolineales bacterium]